MDTIAAAAELVDELRAALGDKVDVSTDPTRHASACLAGVAVLVQPPVLDFGATVDGGVDVTWRLIAAVRVPGGQEAAWKVLDAALAALAASDDFDLDRAEPGVLPVAGIDTPLPAYVITLEPVTY